MGEMKNKNNESPTTKARRQYNKMIDYCDSDWSNCEDCPGTNQCENLGFKGRTVKFDKLPQEHKEKVIAVLGVPAKELNIS